MIKIIKQKVVILGIAPITILVLCLSYSFNSSFSFPFDSVKNNVELGIELGRGPGCRGRGICKIEEAAYSFDKDTNAKGKLYFNERNQLTLDIYKQDISASTKNLQFVNSKFEIIDSYTIPIGIMEQLGKTKAYNLRVGEYKVTETKNSFVIEF